MALQYKLLNNLCIINKNFSAFCISSDSSLPLELDRDPGSIPVPVRNWPKTGIPVPVPVDENYRDFHFSQLNLKIVKFGFPPSTLFKFFRLAIYSHLPIYRPPIYRFSRFTVHQFVPPNTVFICKLM